MRVIKFRVFDNYTKSMHMCGQDSHDTISFSYPDNQVYYYNLQNGEGSLKGHDGNSTYELMQYTGLKDKNGREVYEGDIVSDQYANIYTPIFRNGIYMAFNVDYLHLTEQEPSTQFNVVWKGGCEVIGNIYENPELLEKEQSK